jgi:hypothetical protein
MNFRTAVRKLLGALAISSLFLAGQLFAAELKGRVFDGGAPTAQSTATLCAASTGAPKQLAKRKTGSDSKFTVHSTGAPDFSLYLLATGGMPAANKPGSNPPVALITVRTDRQTRHEFVTIVADQAVEELIPCGMIP